MAGLNSWNHEIVSSVAAPRLFLAGVMDWHTLAPKLTPEIVDRAVIQGDGHIGSVREVHFNPDAKMPFTCMKERLDFVDPNNYETKSTVIEGGGIGLWLETATTNIKIEPKAGGGCVVKVEWAYKVLPGVETTSDLLTLPKISFDGIFQAAETYLIKNPEAYNEVK